MTRIIVKDEDFSETIVASEEYDEEFYDILVALIDAWKEGTSYTDALYNVIGSKQ